MEMSEREKSGQGYRTISVREHTRNTAKGLALLHGLKMREVVDAALASYMKASGLTWDTEKPWCIVREGSST